MLKAYTFLVSLLTLASSAQGQDAFSSMRCGSLVPNTLVGKVIPQGPVADIETKYRELSLRGDALYVEKTESASAIIYWDGSVYRWYQQGD